MPTTLNRQAYLNLVNEDLEWLLQQPRTLERDHIEHILRWTIRENQSATMEPVREKEEAYDPEAELRDPNFLTAADIAELHKIEERNKCRLPCPTCNGTGYAKEQV